MPGILPKVWSLTDSLLAQYFYHIGYKADNHNFVDVGKRDCRIFLGTTPCGFLLLSSWGIAF